MTTTARDIIAQINAIETKLGRTPKKYAGTSKQSLQLILNKIEREADAQEVADMEDKNIELVEIADAKLPVLEAIGKGDLDAPKKKPTRKANPAKEVTTKNALSAYCKAHNLNPKVARAKLRAKGHNAPYDLATIKKVLATK